MADRQCSHAETAALLNRIVKRDSDALRELYEVHSGLLFAIGMRLLHQRADAEELCADVFVEIWNHADRFDPSRGNPLSYLILITRSRALDRLRVRRPVRGVDSGLLSTTIESSAGPLAQTESNEQNELLLGALKTLTPEQKKAVEMAFLDGLSHSEISEKLSRPLGTVKTQIRQGLIQLRAALRSRLWKDEPNQ